MPTPGKTAYAELSGNSVSLDQDATNLLTVSFGQVRMSGFSYREPLASGVR